MIRKGSLVRLNEQTVTGNAVLAQVAAQGRQFKVRGIVTRNGRKLAQIGKSLALPVDYFNGIPQKRKRA